MDPRELARQTLKPSERELLQKESRDLRRQRDEAQREAAELKTQLDAIDTLGRPVAEDIEPQEPRTNKTRGVAILVASDWHVEEIVTPESVSGLNVFNPDVAERRGKNFFATQARLIKILEPTLDFQQTVLFLGGDFITNNLHEDSAENCALRPMEAAEFAQDLLASGIAHLLDRGEERKLTVICHSGNHGRVTRRIHFAQEHGHSLEYLMYRSLARAFSKDDRVTFITPKSYHSYLNVFGVSVRFHHGHAVMYHGGIGGITIPVNKAIAEWDKGRRADVDFFGHFHQYLDGGKFMANGSLIGYNAYALSIKASPEPPRQTFTVIDEHRGRTWTTPVYVDEAARH